ncbi:MAG: prephenate dehydratase [Actinomycetota bacterium]|nr:prephenate dehydratase [Actinomycetota bacterium]
MDPDARPATGASRSRNRLRTSFLGPAGTFTEEALLTQGDLAAGELVPTASLAEALAAAGDGRTDMAFVPIENSIEGSVNATLDSLVFDHDLLIQREVILDIHLHLMARPGTAVADVRKVLTFPEAAGQCRRYLSRSLPGATVQAASSTSDAARHVGGSRTAGLAAIAPALSAKLYGLAVLDSSIEDHPDNQTRFVVVARDRIPARTGHDRTSIACFQHRDRPGSLHSILGQFSARGINLTRLESRPTKRALGDYCFIIDLEGHVSDEVVADCLRDLHAQLADLKFLGSYPAAGDQGPARRRRVQASWRQADSWIRSLHAKVQPERR